MSLGSNFEYFKNVAQLTSCYCGQQIEKHLIRGDFNSALPLLIEEYNSLPRNAHVASLLSYCYIKVGLPFDAEKVLNDFVSHDCLDSSTHWNFAVCYSLLQNCNKSLFHLLELSSQDRHALKDAYYDEDFNYLFSKLLKVIVQ
jgi:hypothetical protein